MKPALFGLNAWAPLARALRAFVEGDEGAELVVHTDEGHADLLPVSIFFRSPRDFRGVDREAVARARGRVLDAGAGAGSLTLALQSRGLQVTALEVIPEAVEIMRQRGVVDARAGRVEDLPASQEYDTILLLMNGTALAGTLGGLEPFLRGLAGLTAPGGQLLVDSTDLRSHRLPMSWPGVENPEDYPGNLQYQLEFQGRKGAPFPQLFVDPWTLGTWAGRAGWETEVVWQEPDGEFLARLVRTDPGTP